jgi:hypothetical protein
MAVIRFALVNSYNPNFLAKTVFLIVGFGCQVSGFGQILPIPDTLKPLIKKFVMTKNKDAGGIRITA